jgi:lactoylglutathione lyase
MTTTFHYTHTRLLVTDFPACVRFYRDLLGFKTTFGDENSVYTEFDTGSVRLSLYGRQMMADIVGDGSLPLHVESQPHVLLYIAVENVDAAYDDLKSQGIEFLVPPTDRPAWGLRTAHFRDPDGNLVEIGHAIPMGDG